MLAAWEEIVRKVPTGGFTTSAIVSAGTADDAQESHTGGLSIKMYRTLGSTM